MIRHSQSNAHLQHISISQENHPCNIIPGNQSNAAKISHQSKISLSINSPLPLFLSRMTTDIAANTSAQFKPQHASDTTKQSHSARPLTFTSNQQTQIEHRYESWKKFWNELHAQLPDNDTSSCAHAAGKVTSDTSEPLSEISLQRWMNYKQHTTSSPSSKTSSPRTRSNLTSAKLTSKSPFKSPRQACHTTSGDRRSHELVDDIFLSSDSDSDDEITSNAQPKPNQVPRASPYSSSSLRSDDISSHNHTPKQHIPSQSCSTSPDHRTSTNRSAFSSMSVSQLLAFLRARGVEPVRGSDRQELIAACEKQSIIKQHVISPPPSSSVNEQLTEHISKIITTRYAALPLPSLLVTLTSKQEWLTNKPFRLPTPLHCELSANADIDSTIAKLYRRCSMLCHPDRHASSDDPHLKLACTELFKLVNHRYAEFKKRRGK